MERMNDELGPDARALLGSYKRERPGQGARARNLQGVQRRLATRSRPERSSMKRQLAWGFAAAAAAALLLLVLDRVLPQAEVAGIENDPAGSQAVHGEATPIVPAPVDAKAAVARPAVVPAVAPTSEPVPMEPPVARPDRDRTPARPSAPPASTASPPVDADALAEETRLVARARAALGRGDLDAAQAAVDDHASRFPDGALVEDRIAYATIVACRRSEVDRDAKRREFLQRYPRSPHRPRIDEACE